jgi:hypothetical protein
MNDWSVLSGVFGLRVRRTIARISRADSARAPLSTVASFTAVEGCIMDTLGGFGFTRALIFPYDELDFCRSST